MNYTTTEQPAVTALFGERIEVSARRARDDAAPVSGRDIAGHTYVTICVTDPARDPSDDSEPDDSLQMFFDTTTAVRLARLILAEIGWDANQEDAQPPTIEELSKLLEILELTGAETLDDVEKIIPDVDSAESIDVGAGDGAVLRG